MKARFLKIDTSGIDIAPFHSPELRLVFRLAIRSHNLSRISDVHAGQAGEKKKRKHRLATLERAEQAVPGAIAQAAPHWEVRQLASANEIFDVAGKLLSGALRPAITGGMSARKLVRAESFGVPGGARVVYAAARRLNVATGNLARQWNHELTVAENRRHMRSAGYALQLNCAAMALFALDRLLLEHKRNRHLCVIALLVAIADLLAVASSLRGAYEAQLLLEWDASDMGKRGRQQVTPLQEKARAIREQAVERFQALLLKERTRKVARSRKALASQISAELKKAGHGDHEPDTVEEWLPKGQIKDLVLANDKKKPEGEPP